MNTGKKNDRNDAACNLSEPDGAGVHTVEKTAAASLESRPSDTVVEPAEADAPWKTTGTGRTAPSVQPPTAEPASDGMKESTAEPAPPSNAADREAEAAARPAVEGKRRFRRPTFEQTKSAVFLWAMLLVSGFLRAFAIHSFINPNDFAPGGVTGAATMLTYATGWNTGYYLFLINIPLLVIAFFFVSKMFAFKTGVSILVSSLALLLLEKVNFFVYTDERILAAVAGGLLGGVGLALMFKAGGSSGGTDILATIIHRKFKAAGVSWFIFALDSVVVVVSFFVYGYKLTPVLLSFVEMFFSARACDMILNGIKSAIKFEVITTHPDEIADEIMEKLLRGVTKVDATGMYSHDGKALLICIVRRRQIAQFQKIIRKYPETFAYISTTSEVLGRGFGKLNE